MLYAAGKVELAAMPAREIAVMSLLVAPARIGGRRRRIVADTDVRRRMVAALWCAITRSARRSSPAAFQGHHRGRPGPAGTPTLSFLWDILFFGRSLSLMEATGALLSLAGIYLGSVKTSQQA
jgi:hypothetical protein